MQVLFSVVAFIFGACMGSFLCCQARRLRIKEISSLKTSKSPKPLKSKKSKKSLGPRSICLSCKTQLKWYENLPLISWLALRGKCRHCHHKIGLAEFISELGTGVAFLAIFLAFSYSACSSDYTLFGAFPAQNLINGSCSISPLNYIIFALIALLTLILIFLAIYDGLYGELPSFCLIASIICAAIILALREWSILSISPFSPELITNPLISVLILSGLYLLLYLISKGKWVGDGDWLLGFAIGLALANPFLALITLFLSNFIACLVMYPATKGNRQKKIHFGPFMVTAFIITLTFAEALLNIL